MRISRDLTTQAEVNRARVPYDSYGQCHACGWTGCAGDFDRHVQAKHPQPDVSMRIYRG